MSLKSLLIEAIVAPFDHNIKSNNYGKYSEYTFSIQNIDFICVISPNPYQKNYYDVAFAPKGGTVKDRIGKDLSFMNSVLRTVAECMIDFIDRTDKVKILAFDAKDSTRLRSYVRFFRNHPYFSQFEVDDSFTKGGFVEININKTEDL